MSPRLCQTGPSARALVPAAQSRAALIRCRACTQLRKGHPRCPRSSPGPPIPRKPDWRDTHKHTCTHIYTHIPSTHKHTSIHTYLHTYVYTHVSTHTTHMYTQISTHMYTHHLHTYLYTQISTQIYTHTCVCLIAMSCPTLLQPHRL